MAVLALAALHLAVLGPAISRSFPADDTLLLVPSFLGNLDGHSVWGTFAHFLGANQRLLPRALWKVYVLATHWAFGPSNSALVWVGVLIQAATSTLVWALTRRLGLPSRIAWSAAGLHFTAYLGFHSYLWPVGVQHALTILGILALLDLYLATDQRRRAGRPYRLYFWATVVVAVVSSLSRASSAVGPVAVLAHAVLAPGDPAERLRRYDLWRPPMLVGLLYPIALLAYGGDPETLAVVPAILGLQRRLEWQAGLGVAFALGVAGVFAVLAAVRLVLWALIRREWTLWFPGRPWASRALLVVGAVLAAPCVLRVAAVLVWGVEGLFAPLGIALNGQNTTRWHLVTFPLDLLGVGLAAAVLVLWLRTCPPSIDALGLAVLFASFGLMLYAAEPRPIRYWIYVTPALAILVAGALDAGVRALTRAMPGDRMRAALLMGLWAVVALQNIAAVRVALWRHKVADTYQALDYIRAADLIRLDLDRSGGARSVPVCLDGIEPLPNEEEWRQWFTFRGAFRHYNIRAILAQALGRRDIAEVRVDCADPPPAGARRYTVEGTTVLRSGQSIDPFDHLDARVRALLSAEDLRAARALIEGSNRPRPFLIRYLLESLRDDDVVWVTNGQSLLAWADRVAANHDNWSHRRAPKIESLRGLVTADVTSYVRFLFLSYYVETRTAPATASWSPPSTRLPFGALTMRELDTLVRPDPLVSSTPRMQALLDDIVTMGPGSPGAKDTGAPRTAPDVAFVSFLTRLLFSDLAWWSHAVVDWIVEAP